MQKEMIQVRNFSRALSIICTILIVLLCIAAFSMLLMLVMSGNSQISEIIEEAFMTAGMGDSLQILNYVIVYTLLNIGVYLAIAFLLRGVLRNIANYQIFDGENTKRLDIVAYILIISAFVLPLVITVGNMVVAGGFSYEFSVTNIIMGLVLLLLSKILLYGRVQKQALDEAQQELKKRYDEEQGTLSPDDVYREI